MLVSSVSVLAFQVLVVFKERAALLEWKAVLRPESNSLPMSPSPLSSTHPPLERCPGAGFYQILCASGHGL